MMLGGRPFNSDQRKGGFLQQGEGVGRVMTVAVAGKNDKRFCWKGNHRLGMRAKSPVV